MYYNGQIVHSYSQNGPVIIGDPNNGHQFAWVNLKQGRTTHYIENTGALTGEQYKIYLPTSLEDARERLEQHRIVPSPTPHTHHWRCGNWLSNHDKGCCSCFKK